MIRKTRKIKNIILFTLISIFFIGIGYAIITSTLNLNGTFSIDKATWNVHFENIVMDERNTIDYTPTLDEKNTKLTYSIKLNKPGDFYSFSVDIINEGSINAMLSDFDYNNLTDEQKEYIEYEIKYLDGKTPTKNDSLISKDLETLVITIKYKEDIEKEQLLEEDVPITLNLTIPYMQDNGSSIKRPASLYSLVSKESVPDNVKSKFVSSETGIDLSNGASDTNGKGIYEISSTSDDKFPIYYYRGLIENNNVIFADYCWQIIRTTETGGTKIIYNGRPDENNACNPTAEEARMTLSYFGPSNRNANVGYMRGDSEATTYEETHANLNDSSMKVVIDKWYESNLLNYTRSIEDTIYCNDRSIASGNGILTDPTVYSAKKRTTPTLECKLPNDRFTVSESIGNGALKYPVAIITADEAIYSGVKSKSYLNTGEMFWTMTPSYFSNSANEDYYGVRNMLIGTTEGYDDRVRVSGRYGIRPVISLKYSNKVSQGTGTKDNPYIVN